MRSLILLGLLLVTPPALWAGQVCFQRSTGTLFEYQSAATPGTCTRNAVTAGIAESDVEERQVTAQEWVVLEEKHVLTPNRQLAAAEQPVEIPLGTFGAGAAGALAVLGGQGLVVLARKKKEIP